MRTLRFICLRILYLAKQVWLLPRTAANALKQRLRQAALDEIETERLDRIRNPSKYVGK